MAAVIVVTFPEVNGATHVIGDPYPLPPVTVATSTFSIPAGEQVVSATASGFWGSTANPLSTAGVNVLLDGVLVAQCVKPDTGCWANGAGQRPWSFNYGTAGTLQDGSVTMTYVQTSEAIVRLGVTTLTIVTAPRVSVPTLSPWMMAALVLLLAGMAAFGARRRR
jgi:hypothetical protein